MHCREGEIEMLDLRH